MKNTDITKIRQLLKNAIEYEADYAYDYIIKKCKEALALLPCETCDGTGRVPTPQSIGFGKQNEILDTCPDCEKKPEDMLTEDYMECWLIHPKDDEDCNTCPNIVKCRDLREYWRPKKSICGTCGDTGQCKDPLAGNSNMLTLMECPDCQQNKDLKNVAYPICPINMYFEGDEDKCSVAHCDFDLETRSCSHGCKINVTELQKELDKIKPGCTKGKLKRGANQIVPVAVMSDGKTAIAILGDTTVEKAETNIKELIRRWDAFEENGLVGELLDALEMAENWLAAISKREGGLVLMVQACPYEADNHTRRKIQTALRNGKVIKPKEENDDNIM